MTGKCDFYFLDCRCWYDVGTGPRAEDNYIHQWRNPPDFQRELHCITINVGAVFGPALFYPEQADRLLHDYLLPAMQLPYITELDLYEVTNYSTVCLIMIFAGLLEHGYTATEVLSKLWINSSDRDLINEVHNILTYRLVA